MPSSKKVERPVSAGGVVYRIEDQDLQILLCGWRSPSSWTLPKGTPDPGETLEQTALREVREETGLDIVIQAYVDRTQYWFTSDSGSVRYHKTVHFYLMSPVGGSLSLHDPEFDLVQWFPAGEAVGAMTHTNDARIVEKAVAMVKAEAAQ